MSETPRTDAAILDYHGMVVEEEGCVPAKFARELEREIARLEKRLFAMTQTALSEGVRAGKIECELNEMNAWKAGMKGVEEFYAMRHQRDEWRKCAEKLAKELRGWLESDYPASYLKDCEVLAEFERMKQPLTPALSPRPTKGEGEAG